MNASSEGGNPKARANAEHKSARTPKLNAHLDQAAEAFRAQVDDVVPEPGDKRGEVNATLRGEVMSILDIVSRRKTRNRSQVITKRRYGPWQPFSATVIQIDQWLFNPVHRISNFAR